MMLRVISFHVRFYIFYSFKPGSSEYVQPAAEQIFSRRCERYLMLVKIILEIIQNFFKSSWDTCDKDWWCGSYLCVLAK